MTLKLLRTQPPFPNSAMDGYAIRSGRDAAAATTLTMVGESARGPALFEGGGRSGRGGADLHGRANARRPPTRSSFRRDREAARARASVCQRSCRQGTICVPAGMDFSRPATILIPAGQRLGPRDVALAAAAKSHRTHSPPNAPGSPFWRPAMNWSRPAERSGRRKSSPPTISAVAGLVEAYGGVAIDLGHRKFDELKANGRAAISSRAGRGRRPMCW